MPKPQRDRFDDVPRAGGRVGAHRAEQPGMNGWLVLLWSIVAAIVLIVVGVFVSLVLMGRISLGGEAVEPPAPPPETGIVDTSYRVLILNATPDDGLDLELRDMLIGAGWESASLLNSRATSSDFPMTTVFYVNDDDRKAALGIAELIGGAKVQEDPDYPALTGGEGKQIAVVIGLDRSRTSPPAG